MLYLVKAGKIPVMNKRVSEGVYKKAFQEKIAAAQRLSGLSNEEIADRLGTSIDQYVRYKSQYWMRVDLIVPFCEITGVALTQFMAPPPARKARVLKSI